MAPRPQSPPPLAAPYATAAQRGDTALGIHDEVAAAAGLPLLRLAPLPAGYRELRISSGHGMIFGARYPLLRIVAGPRGVAGELLWFWAVVADSAGPACGRVRRGAAICAGRARLADEPDWPAVLARLDSLGVWTLPDQSALQGNSAGGAIFDGLDAIVETRIGPEYRAYSYNGLRQRPWPEARSAERIVAVMDALAARAGGR